jgi:serine/threonine protein kinase
MSASAWTRIEPIVEAALALDRDARAAYLDQACDGDATLRQEVDALIGYAADAEVFLAQTALEDASRALTDERSPSSMLGRQVAGYRLDALLGIGGAGEVYRARDLRLDRDVAIKILWHLDSDRPSERRRVEAEARSASRLNHPNIVTIYAVGEDDGLGFIAMELVQGQTLGERMSVGRLPADQLLTIAVRLADALAAAHAEGIVHRDLKPENVMITPTGAVKVLDFGIARRDRDEGERAIAGTAGYIAPEVLAGEPARAAADQYAFGVILREMVAGAPSRVAPIIARCLEADPSRRFPSAAELAAALRQLRDGQPISRRQVLMAVAGLAGIALAGAAVWRGSQGRARQPIAVLPFRNTSGDADIDYLASGLTATLIERLALMPALQVASRSLVANFKDATIEPRDLGRQLGADVVLSGTVNRQASILHIATKLADVATGTTLWSAEYQRPASELLIVEEQIAQAIVDEGVKLTLSAEQRRRLTRRPTRDAEAWQQYLQAIYLCQQETEDAYLDARDLLGEALARDPQFAAAHVQMATTFAVMAVDGFERPTDAWPESSRHVRRALEIDPDLTDAYASSASHEFFFNWNWEAAEAEWRQAMRFGGGELHPDFYTARALQRWAVGRGDEALAFARQARAIDPISPMFAIREADFLTHAGRPAEAVSLYRQVLSQHPDDSRARFGLSDALRDQGRLDDALAERRAAHVSAGEGDIVSGPFSASTAEELRRLDARSARAELQALVGRERAGGYVSPLDLARQHARLGEYEAAEALFDRALADRSPGLTMLNVDAVWAGMRGGARFSALRERVRL